MARVDSADGLAPRPTSSRAGRLLAERGLADRIDVRSGGIAPYARDGSLVSLDARLVLREVGIEVPPGAGATDLKT